MIDMKNRVTASLADHENGGDAIVASGVHKVFASRGKTLKALGPIDLNISHGEFVCLVGPSGCGKSTLLRMIAGLTEPSEGVVTVDVGAKAKQPISMVFQDYGIYPWKTVSQNIRFGLDVTGLPRGQSRERVATWVERLRLQGFEDSYPHQLSGGMKQRVAIARALATDPELLLMDEPFAALDAQLREVLQDELLALWQANRRTVVFVTHSLEEALVLADRVIVMGARPGRVVADITVPFERPRTGDARNTREFVELRSDLWTLLRAELGEAEEGDK